MAQDDKLRYEEEMRSILYKGYFIMPDGSKSCDHEKKIKRKREEKVVKMENSSGSESPNPDTYKDEIPEKASKVKAEPKTKSKEKNQIMASKSKEKKEPKDLKSQMKSEKKLKETPSKIKSSPRMLKNKKVEDVEMKAERTTPKKSLRLKQNDSP